MTGGEKKQFLPSRIPIRNYRYTGADLGGTRLTREHTNIPDGQVDDENGGAALLL
jgi:hypothetical protein